MDPDDGVERPTLASVAALAQVSKQTVSNVLNSRTWSAGPPWTGSARSSTRSATARCAPRSRCAATGPS